MTSEVRRLEELSLNSSTPPGQRLYDGWLLRFSPGKAKRARSVNALYPSRLPLEEKVRHCERAYAEAGLPALFRITPFSEPEGLDACLEQRGYRRFDDTAVESADLLRAPDIAGTAVALALPEWVGAVAALRGSPPDHRDAHLARLQSLGLPLWGLALARDGRTVAAGLVVIEDGHAGLFDVLVAEDARRRGYARDVVASLLALARDQGARHAYLQVQRDNEPARRLYASFGFRERYSYWYRGTQ